MKRTLIALFFALVSFSVMAKSPLHEVRDVDLVREVLRRGLIVDATKVAQLSASCRGSSLSLSVQNESLRVMNEELVHMISGVRECEANLDVIQNKMGDFYDTTRINVCVGSTLKTYLIDSNLNIVLMSSKLIGLSQCLSLARELNRHQD